MCVCLCLYEQLEVRSQLRANLAGLPKPSNEFEIVTPDVSNSIWVPPAVYIPMSCCTYPCLPVHIFFEFSITWLLGVCYRFRPRPYYYGLLDILLLWVFHCACGPVGGLLDILLLWVFHCACGPVGGLLDILLLWVFHCACGPVGGLLDILLLWVFHCACGPVGGLCHL